MNGREVVRLEFDRGTILCSTWPKEVDPGRVPGLCWDERVRRHRAPAHEYGRLRRRLESEGLPFQDAVPAATWPLPRLPVPELRPYQHAALAAWELASRRGVVVMPTGSGKTRVAVAAVARRGTSCLCLVPTRVPLHQWRSVLTEQLGLHTGCYGDGAQELGSITVATFESAYRHMHSLGNRFELLIVDEAHHFGSGARDETLEMCTARDRLGLTATPPTGAAADALAALLGPNVHECSIQDLKGSFLADYELVELRATLTAEEQRRYRDARRRFLDVYGRFRELAPLPRWEDFMRWAARTRQGRDAIRAWHDARNLLALTTGKNDLVGRLLDRHRDARTLVFTAHKEAAYAVARMHLIMPITSDIRHRERAAMIEAFRRGDVRALVSARVLNEGFDVPDADVGIVVSGAHGAREHTQRVGRLLRPSPGKRALVYELVTPETVDVPQAQRRRRGLGSAATM